MDIVSVTTSNLSVKIFIDILQVRIMFSNLKEILSEGINY